VRLTRHVLFGLLGATVLAVVALIITSNVEKGPAHNFELVPQGSATDAELRSDAGTMVRRVESLGFTAQALVRDGQILLTMYGSEPQLRSAVVSSLMQGRVYLRPVECAAPIYAPNADGQAPVALRCDAYHTLSAATLKVNTKTGTVGATIPPQPDLAAVPSVSAAAEPEGATVIVPAGPNSGFGGERLVLGPASLGNSGIASAQANQPSGSEWEVDLTLTSSGTNSVDVLTEDQFHAFVAFEVDANALSAQLIEPTESSYSALGGSFQVAGGFTKSEAVSLADDITSPLVVPLRLSG
jgi:SecDF, P1 head subdomain